MVLMAKTNYVVFQHQVIYSEMQICQLINFNQIMVRIQIK